MRYIRLYKNVNVNNGRQPYHVFTDFRAFLKGIEGNLLVYDDINTYRIDEDFVLRLNMPGGRSFADECTYAIETDDSYNDYYRCYFVTSYRDVSRFQEFQLVPDLWGTYISKCTMDEIIVSRSNKNIGNGIFDDVANIHVGNIFEDAWQIPVFGEEHNVKGIGYIPVEDLIVCFTASVVTSQKLFNPEENVTALFSFGLPLSEILEKYPLDAVPLTPESFVEIGVRAVSGINGVASNDSKLGVEVGKIFLLPKNYVYFDSWGMTFHTKTPFSLKDGEEITFKALRFGIRETPVEFPRDALDVNFKWYFGTRFDGIALERSTVDEFATIRVSVGADGVNVDVKQGDRTQDITNAFEVGIIGSSAVPDALQRLTRVLKGFQTLMHDFQAIGQQAQKGKGGTALTSTLFGYAQILGERAKAGTSVAEYDGAITFDAGTYTYNGKRYVLSPWYLRYFRSSIDEERKALLTGASFNVVINSLEDLKSVDYIVPAGLDALPFVIADAKIGNVPTKAKDYIESALKGGVFLVFD